MSRILRSTDIKGALRSKQRGFIMRPSRFAAPGGGGPTLAGVQAIMASVGGGGCLYDLTDPSTLWADTARTTPASVDGTIKAITDLSGNGIHVSHASATPILRSGGSTQSGYYTEFVDSGTGMSAGINFGSSTGFTAFEASAPSSTLRDMSSIGMDYSTARIFQARCPSFWSGALFVYFLNDGGSFGDPYIDTGGCARDTPMLLTRKATNSGGQIYYNGAAAGVAYTGSSTFSHRSTRVSVGADYSGVTEAIYERFKGPIYMLGCIGSPLSDTDREYVESYFALRAGI